MNLLREYIQVLLKEGFDDFSHILQAEIIRAKARGVSRSDVNSTLARGGADDLLALEISVLQSFIREDDNEKDIHFVDPDGEMDEIFLRKNIRALLEGTT